jgi:glycosyltransferase involved in cell wall biosynthesis
LTRRVLYDGEAFIRHRRSGITRYFSELIHEFRSEPELGVEPVTPYRWIANGHLAERESGYIQVPLPAAIRPKVLGWVNAPRIRTAEAVDLVHHSLYEEHALEVWQGRRRICTVHDFLFERFPDLLAEHHTPEQLAAKSLFLNRCDALICISQTTREDLREFHPEIDKPIFVVPHGVAQHFFEPKPARIRRLPGRYLLYVGHRFPHKNTDLLLQAFAAVARGDSDLHLVLIGAHPDEEDARLAELSIADRTVRLHPSDRELAWIYHRAEAFVFPSLYEGFGLPVLEAMAAGCPVIASNTAAVLEVASDSALIFEPDDVEALVAQIERLRTEPALSERLREMGRQRASEFTWRRTAELTAEAYDRAIAA